MEKVHEIVRLELDPEWMEHLHKVAESYQSPIEDIVSVATFKFIQHVHIKVLPGA